MVLCCTKIEKNFSIFSEHSEFPIEITEEGIKICVNDEHLLNAEFPMEVTEEGISNVICFNDEHPSNAEFPIEVTEEGIEI